MHWIVHTVRAFLASWGYWAVVAGLIGEDAGLPVPGETVLMFAAFIAQKSHALSITWIIVAGTTAAIVGDNLGFVLGRHFGPTLIRWAKKLFHLGNIDIQAAKDLLRRRGGTTIFFSRFIFGLRTIAGPLAGTLGMSWKRFLKFNAAGAATWVTAIAFVGYGFANEFQTLLGYIEKASWAMAAGLFVLGYVIWRRQKSRFQQRQQQQKEAA